MPQGFLPRVPRRLLVPLAASIALALTLLAPGCDNVACVFGPDGCNGGGGGGLGENPATAPSNGEWIETASPSIATALPGSTDAAELETPIVLFFTESMAPVNFGTDPPSGLGSAFELQTDVGGSFPVPVVALVADGRMMVLLPGLPLQPDTTYNIVLKETATLADITGQSLVRPQNGLVGSFTTAAQSETTPSVLATWPRGGSSDQSATTEIVVVFDRPMNPATVDGTSFEVLVDGNPPTFDPAPTVLTFGGIATDTRVYLWRSLDAAGELASLGEDVHVEVNLSGAGHAIEDENDEPLPATTFEFDTATFSAPLSAAITSDPTDAIGIDQISGPADLAIEVLLSGAQAGDFLVLTMFGTSRGVAPTGELFALRREVEISAPFDAFTMTAAEIDLLAGSSPVQGRFADGPVIMAFQLRRGSVTSPLRLLDVDPAETGVQSPTLDTVAPTLVGLSTSGEVLTSMRSDQRDLVIVGRANELITRAAVSTSLGDNSITPGLPPSVVGADPSGLFVAAPVRLGVISAANLPIDFEMSIFDQAQNATTVLSDILDSVDGFRQLGQSGPGSALPGPQITVEVFDATTMEPIDLAEVHVVENRNGTVIAVAGGFDETDAGGFATVSSAVSGQTILTVEKAGFDVFTFDGVPTSRLGVPLTPSPLASGSAEGTVGPLDSVSSTLMNAYTRAVVDSRRFEASEIFSAVSTCSFDGTDDRYECPFGPIAVRPFRIGAQSAITVLEPPDPFLYSALTFLKTAEILVPTLEVGSGASVESHLPLGPLLDSGTLAPEERPVDVPAQLLSTATWPVLAGVPIVAVEAVSPGIPGSVGVGRGIAFDDALPADTWSLRAAYPGSADGIQDVPTDELGRLVTQGTIDGDLFLRVEVLDASGNLGGARPRFSLATGAITLPAAPALPANPATPNPGGVAFDLTFPDVLPDALSAPGHGLYRVVLTDSAGRNWTIYRPDRSDAQGANVIVHVPDLAGVFPLAAGPLDCQISVWAWPGLDLSQFLWSDVEREHDLFSHSFLDSFTPP